MPVKKNFHGKNLISVQASFSGNPAPAVHLSGSSILRLFQQTLSNQIE
jgi:hypothetical protein